MKSPNGYGSIRKLSGNRRRPYMVQITTHCEIDVEKRKAIQKRATIGYYATKKEAMIALAEYNKSPYNVDRNTATLGDVWNIIKDVVKVSDERRVVYKRAWEKYMTPIKDRPFSRISGQELVDVVDACPHGYSTKVVLRTILKHIYSYALQNKYADVDLSSFIKIERESVQLQRQLYTSEEIKELWKHKDEDMYQFVLILLYEGMRITELRELPIKNIDMDNGTISITKAKNKQSIRVIPIHDKVKPLVQSLIDNSNGESLVSYKKYQIDYFCKEILGHTPYDTRHTFASKCNELKIDKFVIQRLMGHKPDSVLEQHYLHLKMEELSKEINRVKY